jgi:uncharacterized membrane protein YoaK (UPF0700 family)
LWLSTIPVMSQKEAQRKKLVTLLLVLLLVLGVICLATINLTTNNSAVDLFVPALLFLFVLLLELCPSIEEWQKCVAPQLKPYNPAAPNRAPPA